MSTNGLIIFTSGFGTGSSGQSVGVTPEMAGVAELSQQDLIKTLPYDKAIFSWDEQEEAVALIKSYYADNPDAPIILVGHSFGADSSIEIAEQLKEVEISVSKLVLIDSVGFDDNYIPSNVESALNLYSTSGDGLNGETSIEGARNIGLDKTSHTEIDNHPQTWSYIHQFLVEENHVERETPEIMIDPHYSTDSDSHNGTDAMTFEHTPLSTLDFLSDDTLSDDVQSLDDYYIAE